MQALVLDTNIVLDLFVFSDEAAQPLLPALQAEQLCWFATPAMRDELERVLAYPQIVRRLARGGAAAGAVLARFDQHAQLVQAPARAPVTCADADDQKFIDLAVARRALLLSKDGAVLSMHKRLARLDVAARPALAAGAA